MKIETLEQATEVIDNLTKELNQANEAKASYDTTVKDLQTKVDELTTAGTKSADELVAANTKIDLATKELTTAQETIASLTKEIETVKAELQARNDELNKINEAAKTAARLNKINELGLDLNDEKKGKLLAMSEEAFASIVEFVPTVQKTETPVVEPVVETPVVTDVTQAVANTQGENQTDKDEELKATAAKMIEVLKSKRNTKTNQAKKN